MSRRDKRRVEDALDEGGGRRMEAGVVVAERGLVELRKSELVTAV